MSGERGDARKRLGERDLPDVSELLARVHAKRRVRLIVEADLDPVPGWGDNPEDWRGLVQRQLDSSVRHYNPTVTIQQADQ